MYENSLIEMLDLLHRARSSDAMDSYGPSLYTLERIENVLKELAIRVQDLEKYNQSTHELRSNSDGVIECRSCRNGEHLVDANSVPFCSVLGCNCVCAG